MKSERDSCSMPGNESELDCTTIVVGRCASVDGCILVGHNEDDANRLAVRHRIVGANEHPDAVRLSVDRLVYREPHTSLQLPVPEVSLAYDWTEMVGQDFGDAFINERGVSICCDSAAGTRELEPALEQGGIGHYLPLLLAEQANTAREGVILAGRLIEQYGYWDARIITIADKGEAWILQVPGGHQWLAQRVPDDAAVVLPNYLISRQIDLADASQFLGSPDLITHAVERGWYDAAGAEPFDFKHAYGPPEINVSSLSTSRQQTGLFLLTGREFALDDLPFSFVPQHPVAMTDVVSCLRCVTPHGYTTDQAEAMPGSFHINVKNTTVRPISVWTTQESTVTKLSDATPEALNVVVWRASGVADELPYTPWYPLAMMRAGVRYPGAYAVGDPDHIDLDSAWWTFRLVVTAVDTDYAQKMPEVRAALLPIESRALAVEASLEQAVRGMEGPAAAALLASYGSGLGIEVLTTARDLLRHWQTKL
ncbi:MAG: C69 family dipeptidase [Candidatus Cryosericum sp.]